MSRRKGTGTMRASLLSLSVLLMMSVCTTGCSSADDVMDAIVPGPGPIAGGDWYRPPVSATWQWQLHGPVNTSYDAEIYDIDLFDSSEALIEQLHASGRKVICYFSAGSSEEWRPDAAQFDPGAVGNSLEGWAGERWLDIRSANVRAVMSSRLDLAARKRCDGVEPDNVDAYANQSGFDLTADDQRAFNRFIADAAHARGLSVGLKNDLEQVNALLGSFDFAVNEQCFEFAECAALLPFIDGGKPVFHAEYDRRYVDDPAARGALCAESFNLRFSTLVVPLELDDAFRFSCR